MSMKMRQSMSQFEAAFEHQKALESRRRSQLRKRAIVRSKVRRVHRSRQDGKVRFSVLAVALTATVAVVTVAMFEALTMLAG
jgi:anti-sigma-K factor RskA